MPLVDLESMFERLSRFPIQTFDMGEILLAEGTSTGELLFMLHGAVDVIQDGRRLARIDKPGAVFGEIAVLRGQPHPADVVTATRSSFFIVEEGAALLRSEPLIALYVAVVQSGRLDAANRSLIAAKARFAGEGGQSEAFVASLDDIGAALVRAA